MTGNEAIEPLRPDDPRRLGAYRIVGRIGHGGMGTVFLAEDASGERAAVKVINRDLAHDETFRDRFRREVQSARRVRRFCTAPVLDAHLDDEPLFVVTEFVDGPDLDAFVRDNGPLRGSTLEQLAVGVATALAAIHSAGVIHRDLKPANVLLSSLGPRVIDFGIARALDATSRATRTGQFIGTPAYMAPELIAGQPLTPASDVFAWACVVAYAGTGRAPFDGPTIPAVLYQISHAEPDITGLDEALHELVSAALAKDPAQRPTAQQLLDQLTGRPHAEVAQTAQAVTRTWTPPASRQPTVPEAPKAPQPRRAGSGRRTALLAATAAVVVVLALVGLLVRPGSGSSVPGKVSPVFSDDFGGTDSGWSGSTWISGSGYFDGAYRIDADTITDSRREPAPADDPLPTRIIISTDATVRDGPGNSQFGIYCRGSNEAPSYDFLVSGDGQGMVIRKEAGDKGNKELLRKGTAPGFKKNATNRLQAACEQQGSKVRLRFWINKHLVGDTTDGNEPLPNDGTGLMVSLLDSQGDGAQVIFDNFDISRVR